MNIPNKTILVTGASGYLSSWIVKYLLTQGHTVHATVRDINNIEKVKHLFTLKQKYSKHLMIFEADLLIQKSFDEAMKNCDIVIHTASPYFLDKPKNAHKELIEPAVNGTKNVLVSVNKTETVKRVVLTSSIVTLFNDAKDLSCENDYKVTEEGLNNNSNSSYNTYAFSKTKAEEVARDINMQQTRWDLITIHPGAIFGPSLSNRKDSTSINMMIQFLNGSFNTGVPKLKLGVVDVRDVVKIHTIVALKDNSSKKYIAVAETLSLIEIAQQLDIEKYNIRNRLPKKELPKILIWLIAPLIGMDRKFVQNNINHSILFDNTKSIIELKIKYNSTHNTLNDHIFQLVTDGLI